MTKKKQNITNCKNILLVDADSYALKVLKGRFERLTSQHNYECKYTPKNSIESAKKELKSTKYDVIITELVFQREKNKEPHPEVGYAFIKYLTQKYPELKVICLTGYVAKDNEKNNNNMDNLTLDLKKPIYNTKIIEILNMSKGEQ